MQGKYSVFQDYSILRNQCLNKTCSTVVCNECYCFDPSQLF